MKWIITNWENDMIETPEQPVIDLVNEKFSHYEFKMLSGLRNRDIEDLYASLRESRAVIMHPTFTDITQIKDLIIRLGKYIHANTLGRQTDWMIKEFVFISATPFEDFLLIKKNCNTDSLHAILRNCYCTFYGYAGEVYEMKSESASSLSLIAIREK